MHVNLTVVMAAVVVVALGATAAVVARGRWSMPWWLMLAGALAAHPFSSTLLNRVEDAPEGWLRWAFQAACVMLTTILLAPVYHWLRKPDTDGDGRGSGGRATARPADAPRSSS
ncbi:hypothetical protein [Streptomyces fumanus]|uniref:Uncharacterized protein n=1 Tax=Streptomyces fumanus TaxID=67302 RepID=A0A919ASM1_9ACTN|nr:hypothetical protein [Streptomyces fumanus]GHF22776.1 hypothetical protein GCM10018772_55530 [Streptomyces fumanus]